MTVTEVHALLERHRVERGVAQFERRWAGTGLRSVGVGLTTLRRLAKGIGRDHLLARELWESDLYEARVLSLLIDDPRRMTRAQAEAQVGQLVGGQLAHVFSSCDAPLARAPFARSLAEEWMESPDPVRRGCGHALLYEFSKTRGRAAPEDGWFLHWVKRIDARQAAEPVDVRLAMATALMGIGKRSPALHREALRVARVMGPIHWDPTGACDPFDVVKHLDNTRLRGLLGLD